MSKEWTLRDRLWYLLDRWDSADEVSGYPRSDLVLEIQDLCDAHPELAEEARSAGVPGIAA